MIQVDKTFNVTYKTRGHEITTSIGHTFRIAVHGKLRRVVIDATTPNGVALQIEDWRGKMRRKYYAGSTFMNMYKYRMP